MLEQEYLELMNELKKKHEALEAEERALKVREAKYKVDMVTTFGLVRAADRLLAGVEVPDEFITLWELICDYVFSSTKTRILDIPVEEKPLTLDIRVIGEELLPAFASSSEEDSQETN